MNVNITIRQSAKYSLVLQSCWLRDSGVIWLIKCPVLAIPEVDTWGTWLNLD